jgi:hypothetical protein
MFQVSLICLANSRKLGGRCVAGLRLDHSGWLRPVSPLPEGTLFAADYTLADGTEATPLDVIQVGLKTPRPDPHHPENWLMDGSPWTLITRPMGAELAPVLQSALVTGPELLGSLTARIPFEDLQKQPAKASLALIAPESLYLFHQPNYRGKPQARGRFWLGTGNQTYIYDLAITDPQWEACIVKQKAPHTLEQSRSKFLLLISLGEPLDHYCYKFIATILPLPLALAQHLT